MEEIINIKNIVVGLIAAVAAYLRPIEGDVFAMIWLFGANFAAGLLADLLNGGAWDNKKAWRALIEALIFFSLAAVIYVIGYYKEQPSNALQCVSYVTYTIIYFYGCNILKNLKKIFPDGSVSHKVVSFIHYVVSVEFVKSIPYLSAYMDKTAEGSDAENGDEVQKH